MSMQIRELSFAYDKRPILENISFNAQPGELLCVLGPNGIGKSTLFRCILGLQHGYKGSILIDEQETRSLPPAMLAKKIAYIPQYHTPAFNYSVFHTVLMGTTPQLGSMSTPSKAHEQAALAALEQFGISHLRDRGCTQISGGERQLALIARAVVQQAKILVMDEPTANLDYGNQIRVMEQICQLTTHGYTIVLSTHNPDHALLYADRVLVLLGGKTIKLGTPEAVMTEQLLREVYRVDVRLHTIETHGRTLRICVPIASTNP